MEWTGIKCNSQKSKYLWELTVRGTKATEYIGNLIALHIKVALGITSSLSGLSVELEGIASSVGEHKNWSLVCLLTPTVVCVIQIICFLKLVLEKLELTWLEGDFIEPTFHLTGATCQSVKNVTFGAAQLDTS